MIGKTISYPRRQQCRRLARSGAYGAAALLAALFSVLAVTVSALALAVGLLLAAAGLAIASGHWLRLAARAGVGARSEAKVQERSWRSSGKAGGSATRSTGKAAATLTAS